MTRRLSLRTLSEACTFVDELDASEIGELVVACGDRPEGAVFLEGGRVCWAAARGLSRRLTELLVARAGVPAEEMERHFLLCKERRLPLGEHLVRENVVTHDDLREALALHTVDSLAHLCRADAMGAWMPRSGPGYSPRFTFSTSEILTLAHAREHADAASAARAILGESFGANDWGAAFLRTGTSAVPAPIALIGAFPDASTTLLAMGKWASSALDVVSAFQDPDAIYSVGPVPEREDRVFVAFRQAGLIIAGETSPHGPGRVLNRRAEERRKRG